MATFSGVGVSDVGTSSDQEVILQNGSIEQYVFTCQWYARVDWSYVYSKKGSVTSQINYVNPIYFNMENLVFKARSEMIGSALDQICFLVSARPDAKWPFSAVR